MKMRRTVCAGLMGLAFALTAPAPGMAAPLDEIAVDLQQQGYRIVEVRRTWLGRIQVTAEKSGFRREIVFDRTTGEIRRDLVEDEGKPGAAGRAKSLEEVIERGVDKVSKGKPKREKPAGAGRRAKPGDVDRPTPERAGKSGTGRRGARPAEAAQGDAAPSGSNGSSDNADGGAGVGTSSVGGASGGSESAGGSGASASGGTSSGSDGAGASTGGDGGAGGDTSGGSEGDSGSGAGGGESGGSTGSGAGGESGGGDNGSGAGDTGGGQTGGESSKSGG